MLKIDITPYKQGLYHTQLRPAAEDLELDPDRFRDVELHARFDCQRRRMLVALDVEATATLECDRTLKTYDERLQGQYTVLYAPPSFTGAEEREGVYEEVRPLDDNEHEIDVTEIVRDTLLLAIPARCVSPEARGMELQTTYGRPDRADDRPVEPRWEALRKLLPDEPSDDEADAT